MARKFIDTNPPTIELDTSTENVDRRHALVARFAGATRHNNDTLCDALTRGITNGVLQWNDIVHLSVWCHTDMGPRGVSDIACEVARELLGMVPGRMLDLGGKKSSEYENIARSIRAACS